MITLIPYLACAGVYAALAAMILLQARHSRTGALLAASALATAFWAGAAAAWGQPLAGAVGALDLIRALAWYGLVLHLYRRSMPRRAEAFTTMGLVGALAIGAAVLLGHSDASGHVSLFSAGILLRLALAICQLLLLENLYRGATPARRWQVGLACIGLGALAAYDLATCADAVLARAVSPALVDGRAVAAILVAPLLALAAARNREWRVDIHVSRSAVFHSATLIASGAFLLALGTLGELARSRFATGLGSRLGEDLGRLAEISVMFAGLVTLAVCLASGTARGALRRLAVDHFFTHRFDYRREWLRCIATLSADGHDTLPMRVIRALADVVDSPAGALFLREPGRPGLSWAGSWGLPPLAGLGEGHPIAARLRLAAGAEASVAAEGILVLDTELADLAGFPRDVTPWLAVPLAGIARDGGLEGGLDGCVILARARAPFRLDAEVFALLRTIAREVATYLGEQRLAQVMVETRALRAYGERFAFVAHDIKNVSSQLAMLLANAETHIANPEFQRDMLATVQASITRIGSLLRKLEAREAALDGAALDGAALDGTARRCDVAALLRRLAARPARGVAIALEVAGRPCAAIAEAALEAAVTHLLDNAVTAAAEGGGTVRLALAETTETVAIEIADDGPGMTAEFIRDALFRPFATTRPDGSGIGAFQARELVRGAGGSLDVTSAPGRGTTLRLRLPRAAPFVTSLAAAS